MFAVLTAAFIFPLIFVGAGVTSKDAGMAFPDWPTSDAHLLNPPGWLHDNAKLWEHGHRLVGWTVGLLAIASTVACWPNGGAVRLAATTTLFMIIVQGVLGGLRVTEISRVLAMLHGIWGQVCFCVAAATAMMASATWIAMERVSPTRATRFFQRGCALSAVGVLVQLCLGAAYRHFGWRSALIAHILWAIVVILVLSWLAMWTLEQYGQSRPFGFFGKALAVLIAAQMLLGGLAFLVTVMGASWSATAVWAAPTAHVAAGALMLACLLLMTMCGIRRFRAESDSTSPETGSAVVA